MRVAQATRLRYAPQEVPSGDAPQEVPWWDDCIATEMTYLPF